MFVFSSQQVNNNWKSTRNIMTLLLLVYTLFTCYRSTTTSSTTTTTDDAPDASTASLFHSTISYGLVSLSLPLSFWKQSCAEFRIPWSRFRMTSKYFRVPHFAIFEFEKHFRIRGRFTHPLSANLLANPAFLFRIPLGNCLSVRN